MFQSIEITADPVRFFVELTAEIRKSRRGVIMPADSPEQRISPGRRDKPVRSPGININRKTGMFKPVQSVEPLHEFFTEEIDILKK
jgi:hypothetical protein